MRYNVKTLPVVARGSCRFVMVPAEIALGSAHRARQGFYTSR